MTRSSYPPLSLRGLRSKPWQSVFPLLRPSPTPTAKRKRIATSGCALLAMTRLRITALSRTMPHLVITKHAAPLPLLSLQDSQQLPPLSLRDLRSKSWQSVFLLLQPSPTPTAKRKRIAASGCALLAMTKSRDTPSSCTTSPPLYRCETCEASRGDPSSPYSNNRARLFAGSLVFACILRGKMVFCRWKSILWNREEYPMEQEGFL